MRFAVARAVGDLARISWQLYMECKMQEINFDWIRGDDETETLIFTDDDNAPVDFTDCHFDCDIVPVSKGERIRLSSSNGSISVKNNEVTLIISHDKTEQANWVQAKWDLQQTNGQGLIKTLCGGKITLRKDITYDVPQH